MSRHYSPPPRPPPARGITHTAILYGEERSIGPLVALPEFPPNVAAVAEIQKAVRTAPSRHRGLAKVSVQPRPRASQLVVPATAGVTSPPPTGGLMPAPLTLTKLHAAAAASSPLCTKWGYRGALVPDYEVLWAETMDAASTHRQQQDQARAQRKALWPHPTSDAYTSALSADPKLAQSASGAALPPGLRAPFGARATSDRPALGQLAEAPMAAQLESIDRLRRITSVPLLLAKDPNLARSPHLSPQPTAARRRATPPKPVLAPLVSPLKTPPPSRPLRPSESVPQLEQGSLLGGDRLMMMWGVS